MESPESGDDVCYLPAEVLGGAKPEVGMTIPAMKLVSLPDDEGHIGVKPIGEDSEEVQESSLDEVGKKAFGDY